TVRQNGDCAIVIDTGGRVLEIAHLLDQLWANTQSGLQEYNLVMMSHVAASVVEFAKSQVEWMSDKASILPSWADPPPFPEEGEQRSVLTDVGHDRWL
ncbi:hypothetical protein TELCIR_24490, partial [Teladorsagia circumcincta]